MHTCSQLQVRHDQGSETFGLSWNRYIWTILESLESLELVTCDKIAWRIIYTVNPHSSVSSDIIASSTKSYDACAQSH